MNETNRTDKRHKEKVQNSQLLFMVAKQKHVEMRARSCIIRNLSVREQCPEYCRIIVTRPVTALYVAPQVNGEHKSEDELPRFSFFQQTKKYSSATNSTRLASSATNSTGGNSSTDTTEEKKVLRKTTQKPYSIFVYFMFHYTFLNVLFSVTLVYWSLYELLLLFTLIVLFWC